MSESVLPNRRMVLLSKSDGCPKQSWWTHPQSRDEFRAASKIAHERMQKSIFGNVAKPIFTERAE